MPVILNFRPFDGVSPNARFVIHPDVEIDDIDVTPYGDSIDPSVYNSADWYITTPTGVVARVSPDTTIDIWRD